jgi:hypothetical protein
MSLVLLDPILSIWEWSGGGRGYGTLGVVVTLPPFASSTYIAYMGSTLEVVKAISPNSTWIYLFGLLLPFNV